MAWREQPLVNVGAGATGNAGAPGPEREQVFLNNGLALSVQSGDISKMAGAVVVVGEDTDFSGRGAVARALIRAGGVEYERNREFLKGQVQREGFRHVVYRCPAGPCFYFREVFHAMTLISGHKIPDWGKHLENLFYTVGFEADKSSFHNVVTPLLGAGMAKGTVDISLQALVNGLSRFAPQHLKEVIIVEYDQNKTAEIMGKLKQILSQDQQRRQGQLRESGRGAGGELPGNPNQPAQGNVQTLLRVAQAWVTAGSGDPTIQGALWGIGRGYMGQGGGSGGAGGVGQPSSHQRSPTSSAQQQSGNPQGIPADPFQASLDEFNDAFDKLAICRRNDNTNQKNIINSSTAQDTRTPSGGTNQFDRQTTSRQGGRGSGLLVQPNYKEGSSVDRPTGRDPRPAQYPDPSDEDFDFMDDYFGDRTETQGPNQPNSSTTSGSHRQSGQRDNSAGKGRGRENENPVDDGRGRQGSGVGNHGVGATPGAARGSNEGRPGGEDGQKGRPVKGSGGRADPKDTSAPGNSSRRVTKAGQDPTLATSASPHHGAHGGSRGGNMSHLGMGRGGAPPAKSTQGPGRAERIDPKSSDATPSRSRESAAQSRQDFHNKGDNEMKKKGDNPPAIESSPTVSVPKSQRAAPGQRPRDTAHHTVPGDGKESDEEEEHAVSHGPSKRTGGTNREEKKDKGQGKTNAGRAGHSGEKKGQQPDMTVQSGSPSLRHAKTAQTAQGSTLTRPATFVPNDHRQGRKDEEAQRDAIAWKSNEYPPIGSQGGGMYQGTRQEEDEISNDCVQPVKAPQMQGQNVQQADTDLKDRTKNREREDDPNLAGRNEGKEKREKDKREKQMKEGEPKRKGASGSKGPKQSSARLAQEPDMTGAAFMGSMPDGKMVVTTKPYLHLEGYPDYGTILIEYSFPKGTQGPQHPAPGQPYKGTLRRAYLPDNQVGRRVLELLQKAFDRKLTFHLERSGPNEEWVVEFDDIPHKTSLRGGKEGETPPEGSKTAEDQLGNPGTTASKDGINTKHGRNHDAQENVHSRVSTSSEIITTASKTTWMSSSPPSSSPMDEENEASKEKMHSERNTAIKSLQASKEEAEKAKSVRSIPETFPLEGTDDPECKGSVDVPGKGDTHRMTQKTGSSSTPTPKKDQEKSAIPESSGITRGWRKNQTHTATPSEPSSAPIPNESQEESTKPESQDSASGDRYTDTLTEPRVAPSPEKDQEKSTLLEKAVSTSGQRRRKTHSDSPPESRAAFTLDEDPEEKATELKAPSTSVVGPEKSAKAQFEVDTIGQKSKERVMDTLAEPRAVPSSKMAPEKSILAEKEVSTHGQRERKALTESKFTSTLYEDPEKSAISELEVDASGQKTKETDTEILTEPGAAPSSEKDHGKSTHADKVVSTSGQSKSKISTESKAASTSNKSLEKLANLEIAVDTSEQKKDKDKKTDALTEPRAAPSSEKDQGKSTLAEKEVSTSGQRKSKTHRDSPPDSRTAPVSTDGQETPSTSESKDEMTGQSEKDVDKGTPTDSSSAFTPAEDSARLTNPERDTEEMSHLHPKEHGEPKAENGEVQARHVDPEAEVKNQQVDHDNCEADQETGRQEDREEEEKASSTKTEADSKIVGNMPPGEMTSTTRDGIRVPGYNDCGVIVIDYYIPMGKQGAGDPEPGSPYSGCVERAFLPDNQEGRRVLQLLHQAFERKLTFHLVQTDLGWVVEFAHIPHKTSLRGGWKGNGYPDPYYLSHVETALREYGLS